MSKTKMDLKMKKEKKEKKDKEEADKDLTFYIKDRVELMKQAFSTLVEGELIAMAPAFLRDLGVRRTRELLLDEVLGISSKRLASVLDNFRCPTDTESESDDGEPLETISLDSISSDDDVQPNKNMTVLELLELQARARAIRAQLAAVEGRGREPSQDDDEVLIKEEPPDIVQIDSSEEDECKSDAAEQDVSVANAPDQNLSPDKNGRSAEDQLSGDDPGSPAKKRRLSQNDDEEQKMSTAEPKEEKSDKERNAETDYILEISDNSTALHEDKISFDPTSRAEVEALTRKIDDEIDADESSRDDASWKSRWLKTDKVKRVLATSQLCNALRNKNKELKRKLAGADKRERAPSERADTEAEGTVRQYEALPSIERISTIEDQKAMAADAKQLMKMYKKLLKINSSQDQDRKHKKEKKKAKKLKRDKDKKAKEDNESNNK